VQKAEQRFAKPDGHGMMFTNGTGTARPIPALALASATSSSSPQSVLLFIAAAKDNEDFVRQITEWVFNASLATFPDVIYSFLKCRLLTQPSPPVRFVC
jgi:hypothetical protein